MCQRRFKQKKKKNKKGKLTGSWAKSDLGRLIPTRPNGSASAGRPARVGLAGFKGDWAGSACRAESKGGGRSSLLPSPFLLFSLLPLMLRSRASALLLRSYNWVPRVSGSLDPVWPGPICCGSCLSGRSCVCGCVRAHVARLTATRHHGRARIHPMRRRGGSGQGSGKA